MLPTPETRPALNRLARWAGWVIPVLFLLWLYRDGLRTWFFSDDFAWLSLLHLVNVRHDLLHELFAPAAQGTIRPWSERGFFLLMEWLFGLNSIPYRIVVFAMAAADVLLIAWITLRITGSRIAAFVAPILWTANAALVSPMTWSSSCNEIMCALFLLSSLALFIHYAETGGRKFWWGQLAVFVVGFGALEINIVYPALAAAWILFARQNPGPAHNAHPDSDANLIPGRDRKGVATNSRPAVRTLLLSQIPLAAISAVYFFVHRALAPLQTSGVYVLYFNRSILRSILLYCKWALVPQSAERFGLTHHRAEFALVVGALAVAAFIISELKQHRTRVLFYIAWFAIAIAPMLPLSEHRTDYYLTIPLIGFAMLGAEAAGEYWNGPLAQRAALAIPILAYLWVNIPTAHKSTEWWFERSRDVRTLILGAMTARQTHPGKAIVLDGVSSDLFDISLAHVQFNADQLDDVYLTPESATTINPTIGREKLPSLILPPEVMWHGVTHNEVVVYSPESDHLRNAKEGYTQQLGSRTVGRFPSRVDVGDFLYSWLLGPTWLPPESGVRWMPGSATVHIGVPAGGKVLELDGECPRAQLSVAPRHLMVLVDGNVVGDTRIYDPESTFHRLFSIPVALLAGKDAVEVGIRVDPVHRVDGQDYGVLFGKIAISP